MAKKTDAEKPVEIIAGKNEKHKTETRVFARRIRETWCVQPGCEYQGELAAQGLCFSTKTFMEQEDWRYIDTLIEGAEEFVQSVKQHAKHRKLTDKQYIKDLESHLATAWMNVMTTSDVMVRQRHDLALLKKRVGKKP